MKLWGTVAALGVCLLGSGAEPALDPSTVCDAVSARKDLEGKTMAVVGRYSFRQTGRGSERWLDQEGCEGTDRRGVIWLALDDKEAPKPRETVALDERALERKITTLKQHTSLAKFRFGSADYDRWAVVYGKLESRADHDLQLAYRGDGAVYFFVDK